MNFPVNMKIGESGMWSLFISDDRVRIMDGGRVYPINSNNNNKSKNCFVTFLVFEYLDI